jgi:tRNA/rRNA methyltransferase
MTGAARCHEKQSTMNTTLAARLAIILCEPQSPGNIGAVARAMANFGVQDLRLVNPCEHLHPEARKFAVGASHLLGSARLYPDLASARADLHLTIATTRRPGRLRGELLDSTELPALLTAAPANARIGLVFGREDCGLSSDEVAQCTHAARVVTSSDVGSLNLAQALLLFLYELARDPGNARTVAEQQMPRQEELDGMFGQLEEILDRIAFSNPSRPEATIYRLRQLIARSHPDYEEVALLRGFFGQVASSINNWRGRRRGG